MVSVTFASVVDNVRQVLNASRDTFLFRNVKRRPRGGSF